MPGENYCSKKCEKITAMVKPDKQILKDLYFQKFKCQALECSFQGSYLQALNHLTVCSSTFHNCP